MKNRFIKIICFLLISIFAFSAVSCKNDEGKKDNVERVNYVGTHNLNIEDTDKYLVQNGKTDYVVVIPSTATDMVKLVKTDFIILFKKATGISLMFKYDNSITDFEVGDHYISIGDTSLVQQAGIDKSEYSRSAIKGEGIRLITKGDTIFLLGGSDMGVCNAAYKFLEIYFNYDCYYRNCVEIDQNVTECKFKKLDVTDIPDVNSVYGNQDVYQYDKSIHPLDAEGLGFDTVADEIAAKNLRLGQFVHSGYLMMPIHEQFDITSKSAPFHNVMYYVPKGVGGGKMHSQGAQLCYTAHGDSEALEEMLQLCADKIIFSLKNYTPDKYPYYDLCTFTMTDNSDICNCQACKADYAEVGYAGNLIRFANKLGEKVDAWLESQKDETAEFHYAYRENFKVLIYAYNVYTTPPVDENGNLLADDLVLHDRIGVWHVSSRGVSAHSDIYDEKWLGAVDQVQGWMKVTEKSKMLWFWHNSGNVVNNIYFSDGFTTYSNNFFELMAYGGYDLVCAAHYLQGGGEMTAWQNCLTYVSNKIRWDITRDMDFYIRKYMNGMYLDAGDTMYELLKSERIHYANLVVNATENNNWGRELDSPENYPYLLLKSWVDMCDKAIDEISYLEATNANLYKVVHQRIELETIAHLYKIITLYGNSVAKPFSEGQLTEYKQRMRDIGLLAPSLKYARKPLYEVGL